MTKVLSIVALIAIACVVSGCGSDSNEQEAPTNLTFTSDIATDGSGTVIFSASADGETYFEYKFGDKPGEAPMKSTDGYVAHVYEESGDYTVTVTAFTTKDLSISVTDEITVSVFVNIPATGYTTPAEYPNMTNFWAEEFDGDQLDAAAWTHEIGNGSNGWGNAELEYYQPDNTSLVDGYLVITAKAEVVNGKNYTSSRIITKDKVSVKYGRIDVRAVLPKGQGIWPAIWMLGENIDDVSWPKCGEIDIMEMIGGSGRENTVYGTAHYDLNGHQSSGGSKTLSSGTFSDEFHVYSIEWDNTAIKWLIDDVKYYEAPIAGNMEEFNEDFFFILNVAVGGNWPQSPDNTTTFPQRMIVDYIRVFQPD